MVGEKGETFIQCSPSLKLTSGDLHFYLDAYQGNRDLSWTSTSQVIPRTFNSKSCSPQILLWLIPATVFNTKPHSEWGMDRVKMDRRGNRNRPTHWTNVQNFSSCISKIPILWIFNQMLLEVLLWRHFADVSTVPSHFTIWRLSIRSWPHPVSPWKAGSFLWLVAEENSERFKAQRLEVPSLALKMEKATWQGLQRGLQKLRVARLTARKEAKTSVLQQWGTGFCP